MRTRGVTRREFLVRSAGLAAGAGIGQRLTPTSTARAQEEAWPSAAVAQGTDADSPGAILQAALDAVGGIGRFVKPGQTVCIKPNATWDYPPKTASSSDPDMTLALIQMVQNAGAKRIIVLDHPTMSSAAECLAVSGLGKMLEGLDVEKVFPDRTLAPASTYTVIDIPDGKAFKKISVLKAATEADVRINMAVAKSHVVLPVTLCLKHMMGFLESPPALHASLEQGVTDINTAPAIHADLHILEALRVRLRGMAAGYETDLTNPRLVKRFNQVLAGTDPVLMDAYACISYFGRQPREIRYIKLAGEQGLGELDVKKATQEGRLRVFPVGAPAAQATATPTPAPTATPTVASTRTATASATVAPQVSVAENTPVASAPPATIDPTLTPSPEPTVAPATSSSTASPPTSTPLPTGTPEPPGALLPGTAPGAAAAAEATCAQQIISPNRLLSGALIPVAAVVTGAGLIVGRRLRRDPAPAAPPAGDPPEEV